MLHISTFQTTTGFCSPSGCFQSISRPNKF